MHRLQMPDAACHSRPRVCRRATARHPGAKRRSDESTSPQSDVRTRHHPALRAMLRICLSRALGLPVSRQSSHHRIQQREETAHGTILVGDRSVVNNGLMTVGGGSFGTEETYGDQLPKVFALSCRRLHALLLVSISFHPCSSDH